MKYRALKSPFVSLTNDITPIKDGETILKGFTESEQKQIIKLSEKINDLTRRKKGAIAVAAINLSYHKTNERFINGLKKD